MHIAAISIFMENLRLVYELKLRNSGYRIPHTLKITVFQMQRVSLPVHVRNLWVFCDVVEHLIIVDKVVSQVEVGQFLESSFDIIEVRYLVVVNGYFFQARQECEGF